MEVNLDQELNIVEQNSDEWCALAFYDRSLLQRFATCLQSCTNTTTDDLFFDVINNRRVQAFDVFEYVAAHLFRQWYYQKHALVVEELNYLTTVGTFNRRLAVTLQHISDHMYYDDRENEETKYYFDLHRRVRQLLFDNPKEVFDILMRILPNMDQNEPNFIEMTFPWYESYTFFELTCIDLTLDGKFLHFNKQLVQCLESERYRQCLLVVENNQGTDMTVYHRFYLGICTLAMGMHVNCDENECDDAKCLLESYLSRYVMFVHYFSTHYHTSSSNVIICLSGVIAYLVNYTLMGDDGNSIQLLVDLFAIILNENVQMKICRNCSTYETILTDSIICYLIVYCYESRAVIRHLLQTDENCIRKMQNLIELAGLCGNARIKVMAQLLLLMLTSLKNKGDLPEQLFRCCLSYIQTSLENVHSYHFNRIPTTMFLKSLINIVKYEHMQEIVYSQYLDVFMSLIIDYERNRLCDNNAYQESVMITINILWSLSFNEHIKKTLKDYGQHLVTSIQKVNETRTEKHVKQAICGLLYNLDIIGIVQDSLKSGQNFGKTIGISYDTGDQVIAEMIERELNKNGFRVWTTYDHMDDYFIPSFMSLLENTQYLIVCVSDLYSLNNRCRTELLYATTSGHRVLPWKVCQPTNNVEKDEAIRLRAIETLLQRIRFSNEEKTKELLSSTIDTGHIRLNFEGRNAYSNLNCCRRMHEIMHLEHWTNVEVVTWCQTLNLPGFSKLITNSDGTSVIKLYEFCKQNSAEAISLLNNDLQAMCRHDNKSIVQISVNEFIQFQIEVEKILAIKSFQDSALSLQPSKFEIYKRRSIIKTCTII